MPHLCAGPSPAHRTALLCTRERGSHHTFQPSIKHVVKNSTAGEMAPPVSTWISARLNVLGTQFSREHQHSPIKSIHPRNSLTHGGTSWIIQLLVQPIHFLCKDFPLVSEIASLQWFILFILLDPTVFTGEMRPHGGSSLQKDINDGTAGDNSTAGIIKYQLVPIFSGRVG